MNGMVKVLAIVGIEIAAVRRVRGMIVSVIEIRVERESMGGIESMKKITTKIEARIGLEIVRGTMSGNVIAVDAPALDQ